MDEQEEIIENINNLILNFENSSEIGNYAIFFGEDQLIISPSAKTLNKKMISEIIKNLHIERIEESFQKGPTNFLQIEFGKEKIYYFGGIAGVRVIAVPPERILKQEIDNLMEFTKKLGILAKHLTGELEEPEKDEVEQSLTLLEEMVKEFKVPKFESFKKLVKFALPFTKK